MNILAQVTNNYQDSKEQKELYKMLSVLVSSHTYEPSHSRYGEFMSSMSAFINKLARDLIKYTLEMADKRFREQPNRSKQYYVKDTRNRSLITPFGWIEYKRTVYLDRHTNKTFCYVDRKFSIDPYIRYDACVQSMILEEYSNHNSMIKVGKIVGERMMGAYSLDTNRDSFRISRQTVHNILKRRRILYPIEKVNETPETLYIMVDEKYIPIQAHKGQTREVAKKMVKVACLFSGREKEYSNRYKLSDKFFFSCDSSFWETLFDAITKRYDLDRIKQIVVMGDGASWIKKGTEFLNTDKIKTLFCLDKFHLNQALVRITEDELYREVLLYYIIQNSKQDYKALKSIVLEEAKREKYSDSRMQRIHDNFEYIESNWSYIQNAYHKVSIGCAMEQVISHVMASHFTSVPKAYLKDSLSTYTSNRIALVNNLDLRSTYLKALDLNQDETCINLSKENYDWSFFDHTNESVKSNLSYFLHRGLHN